MTKGTEELIQEVMEGLGDRYSPSDKQQFETALRSVVVEGKPVVGLGGLSPELMENIYAHAYRLYNSGNYHEAGIVFALLVTLDMNNPKYYLGLAASFHREQAYLDAVECYLAVYCMDMTNPIPFYHLYDCWRNLGDGTNCLFALSMVIELSGNNPKYAKMKERCELMHASLVKELESQQTAKTGNG